MGPRLEAWKESKKRRMIDKSEKAKIKKPSVMARYLLEAWGFGLKSAKVVQKEAAMAVADGATHEDLLMLAKLGQAVHDDVHGP